MHRGCPGRSRVDLHNAWPCVRVVQGFSPEKRQLVGSTPTPTLNSFTALEFRHRDDMRACAECGCDTSNPRFCSRSCSSRYWNRIRPKRKRKPGPPCASCGKETAKSDRMYCSRACFHQAQAIRRAQEALEVGAPADFTQCSTCFEWKQVESFSMRGSGIRQRRCKECQSLYFSQWTAASPERVQEVRRVEWKRERVKGNREFLVGYLRNHSCVSTLR